jgi:hypothetical protein
MNAIFPPVIAPGASIKNAMFSPLQIDSSGDCVTYPFGMKMI